MKRKIILLLLLMISISLFSDQSRVYEDKFIRISISDADFEIVSRPHNVMQKGSRLYLHLQYSFKFQNEVTNAFIILRLKESVDLNQLLLLIGKDDVKQTPSPYGMGDIYNIAQEYVMTQLSPKVSRYGQDWGSSISRDISIYKISYENSYVDEVLIQLLNIWPSSIEMPYIVDNKDIDKYIKEDNEVARKYLFYDQLISKNFLIKDFFTNEAIETQ